MTYQWFITLERKRIARGNKSSMDLVVRIFKWLGIAYLTAMMFLLGWISYYAIVEDEVGVPPIAFVSRYLLYYFAIELMMRFFLQKGPVASIKPFLILNITRSKIVTFYVGKTFLSAFNIIQLFFLIPFTVIAIQAEENALAILAWALSMYCIVFIMHCVGILMSAYAPVFYCVIGFVGLCFGLHYFEIVDPTVYTVHFYQLAYQYPLSLFAYLLLLAGFIWSTHRFYLKRLYLDDLEKVRVKEGIALEMKWLDRFGRYAAFLRNDIRLIIRNKRARITVLMSFLFLFYALFMFSAENMSSMSVFFAFFSTGGFLMLFGQYVPSWDSAYYPLLMTQNVMYRDYLMSKWLIIALGTCISTLLCFFYFFIDLQLFYLMIAMGVFNIGINGYLVLWGGAYLKTPMDLTAAKNVFGDANSFNLRVMLISIPKIVLPFLFYGLGTWIYPFWGGFALLILVGIAGLFIHRFVFQAIEKIYQKEKYATLVAFKK
ncbi:MULTISPECIES: DUF5687 family protein [unclassified Myroides]|uniref:DUF5687 family protein n=1 Tax=unclassified Myroides TaxID=2642485 RepID=UPI0015FDDFB4|nr:MULTISPECIES: DUF5687 family protein [unclassified Myroides]MBB1149160.1 hypothetical protein [Myroides sp. NP-2]MDM1406079.1 hypothetical protein [Myroides sp. DF42-4-2]